MRLDTIGALEDIRESIAFIGEDTMNATFDAFIRDRRARQLVAHNLLIIGEALNRIRRHDPVVFERITEASEIVATRNYMIHAYDTINYETVWRTVHNSLPVLSAEVEQFLREASNQ